jgi:hypothetical protein
MPELMDEWVLVREAYRRCVEEKKRTSAHELRRRAQMMYIHWRDVSIQVWAENTFAHVPHERLRALLGKVDFLLLDDMEALGWEYPSEEVEAEWVAYGLACLRWKNRVTSGRELAGFDLSEAEVGAWLAQREWIPVSANPHQPSLFGGT